MDEEEQISPENTSTTNSASTIDNNIRQENTSADHEDTITTDSEPPSPTPSPLPTPTPSMESTPEPNQLRPNIAYLFNTNENQYHAISKPSSKKDTSCEQLFVGSCLCSQLLTINYLAEIDVFLNALTDDSIDRAITSFQEGLHSRKANPIDFNSQRAQYTCYSILRKTERGSTAMATVCDIPKFWINLDGLVHSSNLNAIELTMTRVFCMQGALKFHYWLLDIIPAAIRRISKPGHKPKLWIDKLASDVRSSLARGGGGTFLSSEYLPNLHIHSEYMAPSKPFQYDDTEQLTSILSTTLRWWLHFPTENDSIAQLTLLDILTSNSPTSILFLDKIWDVYKTPFSTVFKNNWDVHRSKRKLMKALEDIKKKFALHPFATTGSSSHSKLQYLSELINEWIQLNGVNANIVS